MSITLDAAAPKRAVEERIDIIDCDVHPVIRGGIRALYDYMPQAWSKRFENKSTDLVTVAPLTLRFQHPNGTALRKDIHAPDGGPAGSDPGQLRQHLMEENGIGCAILNCLQPGALAAALSGPEESAVLCAASNDFFLDTWELTGSGPLRLAMSVPTQDPLAGAAEIARIGANPAIAAVSLPLLNILMGNCHYFPIYKAAEEHGLPILVHVTGADSIYQGSPVSAGGWPANYVERYVSLSQIGEANLASLVFSGVFARFPRLKFLFVEYGFGWVLPLLWRMDRTWRSLRYETPWVQKSPTEYVREHVRFTTQPLDEPLGRGHLEQLIAMLGPELLMFSTDYPHWDNDMPGESLRTLPAETRRMIFAENARAVLRL
jgi:predicted TIM-barrel fold metal-dependent hydrolase